MIGNATTWCAASPQPTSTRKGEPRGFGESIGHTRTATRWSSTPSGPTKNSYIDNFRTPSPRSAWVERFTSNRTETFDRDVKVAEPTLQRARGLMQQRWFKELPMLEPSCAENNRDFSNQGLFRCPSAKPDF